MSTLPLPLQAAVCGATAALLLGGVIAAAQWLLARIYGEKLG